MAQHRFSPLARRKTPNGKHDTLTGEAREEPAQEDRPSPELKPVPNPSADDAQQDARHEQGPTASDDRLRERLSRVERQNVWMRVSLMLLVLAVGYMAFAQFVPENVFVQRTIMESRELKLVDNAGNTRMFLRMYSRVPVLQLMDPSGKPRLSLGLRFDNTPFIDLSDTTGQTRATLELTKGDQPAIRLYDADGRPTFTIN